MAMLDIVMMSRCRDGWEGQSHKVGKYDVFFGYGNYPHCTCPSFKYCKGDLSEKTCKHIEEVKTKTCDYFELLDGPPDVAGICPKCGGPTEYVRVGV